MGAKKKKVVKRPGSVSREQRIEKFARLLKDDPFDVNRNPHFFCQIIE